MKLQRIAWAFVVIAGLAGLPAAWATPGAPLKGVDVKLGRNGQMVAMTRTDPGGGFTFSNVPEGTYELRFSPPMATGKTMMMDDWQAAAVTVTVTPREASSGMATGRSAAGATAGGVISPRDPASGLPTGKRMHKPFVITKELDKATPLLMGITVEGGTVADLGGVLRSR